MRYILTAILLFLTGCSTTPAHADRTAIFLHGGGWHSGSPEQMQPLVTEFAAAGWRTRNLDYPLYPEANVFEQVKWVRDTVRSECAGTRTCVLVGFSAGAHLALMAAESADAVVGLGTGIGLCAPVPATKQETIEAIGPRCDKLEPMPPDVPVLLGHGEDDEIAPVIRAEHFARYRVGSERVELRVVPGGHDFWRGHEQAVAREALQWIDRTLN